MNDSAQLRSVESFLAPDVLVSSRERGWAGVEVMTARIDRSELQIDGLQTHTLAINMGLPFTIDALIDTQRSRTPVAANAMMLIEAGVRSEWEWKTGALEMLHLSVDGGALRACAAELAVPIVPEIRSSVGFFDPGFLRLGEAFASELGRPQGGTLVADGLRVALITRLLERHSSVSGHRALRRVGKRLEARALRRIDDYVTEHLGADIALDDLARLVALSRFHFARAFRAAVGVAPHRYVLERRLERARSMLTKDRETLSAIASATGFADQSHLTRAVKLRYGATPAVLRRNEQDSSRR